MFPYILSAHNYMYEMVITLHLFFTIKNPEDSSRTVLHDSYQIAYALCGLDILDERQRN